MHFSSRRVFATIGVVAMALLGAGCVVGSSEAPLVEVEGAFAFQVFENGVQVDDGGGLVDYALSPPPTPFPPLVNVPDYDDRVGTMATQPGFVGPEGSYRLVMDFVDDRVCPSPDFLGCTLDIQQILNSARLTTPDGALTISGPSVEPAPDLPPGACPNDTFYRSYLVDGVAQGDPTTKVLMAFWFCGTNPLAN